MITERKKQKAIEKRKDVEKSVRKNMKNVLEEWCKEEAKRRGYNMPLFKKEVYSDLWYVIQDAYPGYQIDVPTIETHFKENGGFMAKTFLLLLYANYFGVSLDYLLTGHQNSKISTAENPNDAVDYYIMENDGLQKELRARIKSLEKEAKLNGED